MASVCLGDIQCVVHTAAHRFTARAAWSSVSLTGLDHLYVEDAAQDEVEYVGVDAAHHGARVAEPGFLGDQASAVCLCVHPSF